jgi:glycosyltransferase involved in cell wall biosynthesis
MKTQDVSPITTRQSPLRVALGAYLLSGTPGYRQAGIHQYIRALLEEFGHIQQHQYAFSALVSPSARTEVPVADVQSPIAIVPASRSTESPISRIRIEQMETPRVLRELRADLYHGMAFAAPLRVPCPFVITVFDLSFLTQPQSHKVFNRIYLSLITRWSVRHAARIIAISEWTKRDVVNLLGVDPTRVDAIPLAAHKRFAPLSPEVAAEFRTRHDVGPHAIFSLGSLEPRKNLPTLIEAFQHVLVNVPDAELIVGGNLAWKYEEIFARVATLGLKDKVRFIGRVEPDDLPKWYSACAVFAYPSLYEGFGIPILEAMACGAPVVTSNVTSLPEVVGDVGIMVAPRDVSALADALMHVLTNESARSMMREQSLRRAGQFSWRHTAQLTMDTYACAVK